MPSGGAGRAGPLALACAVLLGLAGCGEAGDTADPTPAPSQRPTPVATPTGGQDPGAGPGPGHTASATEQPSTAAPAPAPDRESGRATVLFTGDLMLARSIGDLILTEGPQAPWEGIADELAGADLRVGVLESAVGSTGVAEDKAYTFQAPPEAAESLAAGGFDVVTLANNHSYDFGAAGLLETLDLVDQAGVRTVGAGDGQRSARSGVVLGAEGVQLGFLGYVSVPDDWAGYRNRDWAATGDGPGVAWAEPELIAEDVARLVEEVDHVVVLLHAGDEGSTAVNPVQVAAAEAAFQAGASAVVGSHPHVLQGWSLEDGRLVAWSLGNTVFDGFGAIPESLETALLTVTFTADTVEDASFVPVVVDDRGLPQALDADDPVGRVVLDRLDALPAPVPGQR